ncbi:MAG: hypothetical protein PVG14_02520 [Anaerolineales bacterium]|jgi:hypothetical protein
MSTRAIPKEVKAQVEEIIVDFNRKTFKGANVSYRARFRGRFLYLDRDEYGRSGPMCRLTYTGKMDGWEFAIFKWSDEAYDPDEWFFPGFEEVDGTVQGAMRAGLEAYPV